MKVLLLNGSIHAKGNTYTALEEIGKELLKQGIDYEIFQIGVKPIQDCTNCRQCKKTGYCIYNEDTLNEFLKKAKEADGYIFGSPVYYAHPSGRILSFLDRAFYCKSDIYHFKPVASVVVARRAGTSTSFDVLNKYATIADMIIVGSSYWNNAFGATTDEAKNDAEGMQTMRNLARNMAYVLKLIKLGKENGINSPEIEKSNYTNFMRNDLIKEN